MAEMDAFERRVADTLLRYADEVLPSVDAAAVAHRVALEHPRRRAGAGLASLRLAAVPRPAWVLLLLAALLTVIVSAVIVGSGLLRRGPDLSVVPPPTGAPFPSGAPRGEPVTVPMSIGDLRHVAVAGDGSAWATTWLGVVHWDLATGRATLYDTEDGLGEPCSHGCAGDQIAIAPDGSVWATGDHWVAHFDGTWTTYPEFDWVRGLEIARDGTVWVSNNFDLRRFDGSWTTIPLPEGEGEIRGLSLAPDGSVWANGGSGVLSYDGVSWTTYTKQNTGLPREPGLEGIAGDGSAWVTFWGNECTSLDSSRATCPEGTARVARYDGRTWTVYSPADLFGSRDDCDGPRRIEVLADGTVWGVTCNQPRHVSRFDGDRWVAAEVPPELADAEVPPELAKAGTTYRPPTVEIAGSVATLRPALVAGPTVTRSALGTITWRVYAVDSAYGHAPVGSTHGPVMLDGPHLRWLAPDGSWPGMRLPIEAWRVQALGDGLVAIGDTGAVRLSWDGARWVAGEHLELPRALWVANGGFVAGPRSTVAVGQANDGSWAIASSADGVHFAMAARPPDCMVEDQMGYVLATEDGFVGLAPTRDVRPRLFEPLPWTSTDGSEWDLAAETSPFGTGSEIQSLASRDGRHVAVGHSDGSRSTVWVSDDGLRWERVASLAPDRPINVAAGPAGWMIVGWEGTAWVSADGRAWDRLRGWPALTAHGGFDVGQDVAFGPGVVAVRGRLPMTGEQEPGIEAIAIGTIEP